MGESVEALSEDDPPPRRFFRRASTGDIDFIISIERACFADDAFSKRQFKHMFKSPGSIALVAQLGEEIAGYIWAYTREFKARKHGRIYSLAVMPQFRGIGVARDLLSLVEREMRSLGVEKIFLEVEESNEKAIKLYSESGFEVRGFLPSYYKNNGAVKMVKKLVHQ